MKLSVFTASTPEITPEELIPIAKAVGLAGIEWRYKEISEEDKVKVVSFWGNNRCTLEPGISDNQIASIKTRMKEVGLVNVSITPYLQAGDLGGTEQVLRIARQLNAPFIRLGVYGYDRTRHYNELFNLQKKYLAEAAELCKTYGVKGLVETHHMTITSSASAAFRAVGGLDPDAIGVLFDPANMVYEGYENYRMGLELLGPYLAHVHVKNASWIKSAERTKEGNAIHHARWQGLREGLVPWKQVLEDLEAIGYDGFIGVEDFSSEFKDAESMLRHYVVFMKELLS
jgi:sugar phosphate isomerase/epimerase